MYKLVTFYIVLVIFMITYCLAQDTPCGDWLAYKEEKCLKMFDKSGLLTYSDAEQFCQKQDASSKLVTITFHKEQDFVAKYLFDTLKIVDNIWIGAKYQGDKYFWDDGTNLNYTNWAPGSPSNQTNACVQMVSNRGFVGKWVDENCARHNIVLCQKLQTWSISKLQQNLLYVMKHPIPVGFIYAQLPNEQAPSDIWPWMIWSDISPQYNGVFFRVLGGKSDKFGIKQSDNTRSLSQVCTHYGNGDTESPVDIVPGYYSTYAHTGHTGSSNSSSLQFFVNDGEVRPENMAIRIWKRTG